MRIVVFGLAVSSAWGNGHATLWRGLIKGLWQLGHSVCFFERDVPYYAAHRDYLSVPGGELHLYASWQEIRQQAYRAVRAADVAIVTSFCPDGRCAAELICSCAVPCSAFYDLDTPVTLSRFRAGEQMPEFGERGLRDFDLVLSFTGGVSLQRLRDELGARKVSALYGGVDPDLHVPDRQRAAHPADLAYLGTYAADRQPALDTLFLAPARNEPERRFVLAGSQYPKDFPWLANISYRSHVPPAEHASFFRAARLHLNVTRAPMAEVGYCPSGRLFEAAACEAAVISDAWPGFEQFFQPGEEMLQAASCAEVSEALTLTDRELTRMAHRARERALAEHTLQQRAHELERLVAFA